MIAVASKNSFHLENYFDRVVLINLKRRSDRLMRVWAELQCCKWPFKQPDIIEAVDGRGSLPPPGWRYGPGAWGCLKSHEQVLKKAIADGVKNILVLEDDVCFVDGFRAKVEKFLREVPDDWEQLMLGGQHMNFNGKPHLIKPGVYRCTDCERTHCYAIRGDFMTKLCERWLSGGKFNGDGILDWIMGRDPDLQLSHKVYSPRYFLAGQERSRSDIKGTVQPRKFWNPPSRNLSVIKLDAPRNVVSRLRQHGFYFGQTIKFKKEGKLNLDQILNIPENEPGYRVKLLREWIKAAQWEIGGDPGFVCTICHPLAKTELVREASLWPVYEIAASSVDDVLRQLPQKLKKLRAIYPSTY